MAKVLWFTGLSGAGKSTIAEALAARLREANKTVEILDGDAVREKLHRHLGFTEADIKENNHLIAELAKDAMARMDVVLVPIIAPFAESRAAARELVGDGFVEVYVHSSEESRKTRDPKGLYKKVQAGEITDMIGHGGVPYESPTHPDIELNTDEKSVEVCVEEMLKCIDA